MGPMVYSGGTYLKFFCFNLEFDHRTFFFNAGRSLFSTVVFRPIAQPELLRARLLLLPPELLPTADPGSHEP